MKNQLVQIVKKLNRKHVLWLLPVFFSFIAGVMFTDYMYRDVPKVQVYTERSQADIQLQTKLLQCQSLANTVVSYDAQIIGATNDLLYAEDSLYNHHISVYPDRLQDIYNLQDQRQPVIDSINNLYSKLASTEAY